MLIVKLRVESGNKGIGSFWQGGIKMAQSSSQRDLVWDEYRIVWIIGWGGEIAGFHIVNKLCV